MDFKGTNLNSTHFIFLVASLLLFYFANCEVVFAKEILNRLVLEKRKDGYIISLKDKIDNYVGQINQATKNNSIDNLITLCVRCHGIVENERDINYFWKYRKRVKMR